MNKLIINVGISGSGKSTWSTNYIKEHPNTLRINRDSIRLTLVGDLEGYYQRKDLNSIEMVINDVQDEMFSALMAREYNVIIDNTNLKQLYINQWIRIAENYKYNIQFKLFDVSLEEAKIRVMSRDCITDISYINKQYQQYKEIKQYLLTHHSEQVI